MRRCVVSLLIAGWRGVDRDSVVRLAEAWPGGGTGAAGRRVRGIRERGTSSIFYATYAELNWLKLRVFLERSQVPDQVGTKKNLKPLRER